MLTIVILLGWCESFAIELFSTLIIHKLLNMEFSKKQLLKQNIHSLMKNK